MMMDREYTALLEQFWGRENTVSAVARNLGLKRNAALYRVQRLLEVGLLEGVRQEPRRGRAITYYQLKAEEFFIPFEMTRFATLTDFIRSSLEGWFQLQLESEARNQFERTPKGEWGLFVGYNEFDNKFTLVRSRGDLESGKKATDLPPKSEIKRLRTWATLNISPQRAKAILDLFYDIQQMLMNIDDEGPEAQNYLLQMTLMPVDLPNPLQTSPSDEGQPKNPVSDEDEA